jgi:acyl carrier protein
MNLHDRLVQLLIDEYKLPAEKLVPDARLDELGIDSLGVMELVFKIEDDFAIQFPSDHVALATVGDLVQYVQSLIDSQLASAAPPVSSQIQS